MTNIKVNVYSEEGEELFGGGRPLPDFGQRAGELADSLNTIAAGIGERLVELRAAHAGWSLDEVQLTCSLDLQAEAGVILARASSRAGFQATLSWSRSEPPDGQ